MELNPDLRGDELSYENALKLSYSWNVIYYYGNFILTSLKFAIAMTKQHIIMPSVLS
jgi:hypothetical protein